jgi:hypothetical protein
VKYGEVNIRIYSTTCYQTYTVAELFNGRYYDQTSSSIDSLLSIDFLLLQTTQPNRIMSFSKNILLPAGLALLVGACSPFYPQPHPNTPPAHPNTPNQQTLTPEQQALLRQSNAGTPTNPNFGPTTQNPNLTPSNVNGPSTPNTPSTTVSGKKNYPTAAPVPGKEGFVFNPYTHNIVDVKGIASGKLCRDPEDADATHKFRVP